MVCSPTRLVSHQSARPKVDDTPSDAASLTERLDALRSGNDLDFMREAMQLVLQDCSNSTSGR